VSDLHDHRPTYFDVSALTQRTDAIAVGEGVQHRRQGMRPIVIASHGIAGVSEYFPNRGSACVGGQRGPDCGAVGIVDGQWLIVCVPNAFHVVELPL
jgi:hypothetical protein